MSSGSCLLPEISISVCLLARLSFTHKSLTFPRSPYGVALLAFEQSLSSRVRPQANHHNPDERFQRNFSPRDARYSLRRGRTHRNDPHVIPENPRRSSSEPQNKTATLLRAVAIRVTHKILSLLATSRINSTRSSRTLALSVRGDAPLSSSPVRSEMSTRSQSGVRTHAALACGASRRSNGVVLRRGEQTKRSLFRCVFSLSDTLLNRFRGEGTSSSG